MISSESDQLPPGVLESFHDQPDQTGIPVPNFLQQMASGQFDENGTGLRQNGEAPEKIDERGSRLNQLWNAISGLVPADSRDEFFQDPTNYIINNKVFRDNFIKAFGKVQNYLILTKWVETGDFGENEQIIQKILNTPSTLPGLEPKPDAVEKSNGRPASSPPDFLPEQVIREPQPEPNPVAEAEALRLEAERQKAAAEAEAAQAAEAQAKLMAEIEADRVRHVKEYLVPRFRAVCDMLPTFYVEFFNNAESNEITDEYLFEIGNPSLVLTIEDGEPKSIDYKQPPQLELLLLPINRALERASQPPITDADFTANDNDYRLDQLENLREMVSTESFVYVFEAAIDYYLDSSIKNNRSEFVVLANLIQGTPIEDPTSIFGQAWSRGVQEGVLPVDLSTDVQSLSALEEYTQVFIRLISQVNREALSLDESSEFINKADTFLALLPVLEENILDLVSGGDETTKQDVQAQIRADFSSVQQDVGKILSNLNSKRPKVKAAAEEVFANALDRVFTRVNLLDLTEAQKNRITAIFNEFYAIQTVRRHVSAQDKKTGVVRVGNKTYVWEEKDASITKPGLLGRRVSEKAKKEVLIFPPPAPGEIRRYMQDLGGFAAYITWLVEARLAEIARVHDTNAARAVDHTQRVPLSAMETDVQGRNEVLNSTLGEILRQSKLFADSLDSVIASTNSLHTFFQAAVNNERFPGEKRDARVNEEFEAIMVKLKECGNVLDKLWQALNGDLIDGLDIVDGKLSSKVKEWRKFFVSGVSAEVNKGAHAGKILKDLKNIKREFADPVFKDAQTVLKTEIINVGQPEFVERVIDLLIAPGLQYPRPRLSSHLYLLFVSGGDALAQAIKADSQIQELLKSRDGIIEDVVQLLVLARTEKVDVEAVLQLQMIAEQNLPKVVEVLQLLAEIDRLKKPIKRAPIKTGAQRSTRGRLNTEALANSDLETQIQEMIEAMSGMSETVISDEDTERVIPRNFKIQPEPDAPLKTLSGQQKLNNPTFWLPKVQTGGIEVMGLVTEKEAQNSLVNYLKNARNEMMALLEEKSAEVITLEAAIEKKKKAGQLVSAAYLEEDLIALNKLLPMIRTAISSIDRSLLKELTQGYKTLQEWNEELSKGTKPNEAKAKIKVRLAAANRLIDSAKVIQTKVGTLRETAAKALEQQPKVKAPNRIRELRSSATNAEQTFEDVMVLISDLSAQMDAATDRIT